MFGHAGKEILDRREKSAKLQLEHLRLLLLQNRKVVAYPYGDQKFMGSNHARIWAFSSLFLSLRSVFRLWVLKEVQLSKFFYQKVV